MEETCQPSAHPLFSGRSGHRTTTARDANVGVVGIAEVVAVGGGVDEWFFNAAAPHRAPGAAGGLAAPVAAQGLGPTAAPVRRRGPRRQRHQVQNCAPCTTQQTTTLLE